MLALTCVLAVRVFVQRVFRGLADQAAVVKMHADGERVVADFMKCLPRFGRIPEHQIVGLLREQPRDFVQPVRMPGSVADGSYRIPGEFVTVIGCRSSKTKRWSQPTTAASAA